MLTQKGSFWFCNQNCILANFWWPSHRGWDCFVDFHDSIAFSNRQPSSSEQNKWQLGLWLQNQKEAFCVVEWAASIPCKHFIINCQSYLCECCKHYALINLIFSFYSLGRINAKTNQISVRYAFANARLLCAHPVDDVSNPLPSWNIFWVKAISDTLKQIGPSTFVNFTRPTQWT